MKLGLRGRMLLLAFLPATLVATLLTAVFLVRAMDDLKQGLDISGIAISRQLAAAAEFGLFAGQRESLAALTESALRIDSQVSGTAIVDASGTVMARSGKLDVSSWPGFEKIESHRHGSSALLFVTPIVSRSLAVDDLYGGTENTAAAAPIVLGHALVELSLAEISSRSERLIAIGLLMALLGSGLGGWLALWIGQVVTKPLLETNAVVARIGEGDLTARVALDSAGVLRSLARGINHMAGRIGVTQDEMKARVAEATADLKREKEAAEHANMAKSYFLASASHDLRQPLHALGLLVSALARSAAAVHEPKLIAQVESAVGSLQTLLDAILDISRLDGGKVVPRLSTFSLGHVLFRLSRDFSPLAQQKGLELRLRRTRVRVHSDPQIIERILLNLVANALRYTRSGGVLVGCRRRHSALRVEVWDTGEGIPEHDHERIFEEYVQLENPERDGAKGLGLGLAICQRLAGVLDMPLGVRSWPGRGSVFWFELPLALNAPPVTSPHQRRAATAELKPDAARIAGTVLVVEDDELVRSGMEKNIIAWGGRVLLAANRDEALRCCRQSAVLPDLAICPDRLPDKVSGIELATELRGEFGPIRILLVGDGQSEHVRTAARDAGFPLLKKPVSPARLRAAVQQLLTASA